MKLIENSKQNLDAYILFVTEGAVEKAIHSIQNILGIQKLTPTKSYKGKKNELIEIYATDPQQSTSFILVGLGKKEDLQSIHSLRQSLRYATGTAARYARSKSYLHIGYLQGALLEEDTPTYGIERYYDLAYAAHIALYKFSLKSTQDEQKNPELYLIGNNNQDVEKALARGTRLGKASSFVRDLVNNPANIVTPEYFVQQAHKMAKEYPLTIRVLDRKAIQEQGMGAFTAVAQGSQTEPYLILLEYTPQGKEKEQPLAIVGKGLVFDSGGISIKPSNNMHEMKADMAGAATALGLAHLLAEESAKRVIIALACAENMPSGTATRPGDIVTTLSGKTVEILNTDAEGRLVLCDTLTYVQNEYNPSTIIDMATLTGACAMALGEELTGLFTNDDTFAKMIEDAGHRSGQQVWRLPLMKELFLEDIVSPIADLQNIGKSRYAGATTAALFLQQFVHDNVRYAHLDIAGTAYASVKNPLTLGSATSAPLAMLFTLITEFLNNE